MPQFRKVVAYTRDALLIAVPLAGMSYFLAYPASFDAFLDWVLRLFR
jgi:hypothetical protein